MTKAIKILPTSEIARKIIGLRVGEQANISAQSSMPEILEVESIISIYEAAQSKIFGLVDSGQIQHPDMVVISVEV